ncbi:MAG: hypothetical protein JW857_08575, partial [Bacteroidales bacterium]|nr:hypothetical protein [Bacteroidales bacterium]
MGVYSQTPPKKTIYCQINERSVLSDKTIIEIDLGQKQSGLITSSCIVDKDGNVVKFNSIVDALNFMGELGWEFCQTYKDNEINVFLLKQTVEAENVSKCYPPIKTK